MGVALFPRFARGPRRSTPYWLGPRRDDALRVFAFVDLRFTVVRKSNLADPTTDEMVRRVCRFLVSSESCSCAPRREWSAEPSRDKSGQRILARPAAFEPDAKDGMGVVRRRKRVGSPCPEFSL
jgi:hypothetical protein